MHNPGINGGDKMTRYLEKTVYIKENILDKLEMLAKKNSLSLSTLLNHIFTKYLESRNGYDQLEEKRKSARKKVVIPALVYEKTQNGGNGEDFDMGRYISTTIFDISRGGLRLVVPAGKNGGMQFAKPQSEFEVISYLSGNSTLFRLKCRAEHIEQNENGVKVGSSFVDEANPEIDKLEVYCLQK